MEFTKHVGRKIYSILRGADAPGAVVGALAILIGPASVKQSFSMVQREPVAQWHVIVMTDRHLVQIIWESPDETGTDGAGADGGSFLRSTWIQPLSSISKLEIREVTAPYAKADSWNNHYDVGMVVHFDNGDLVELPNAAAAAQSQQKEQIDHMMLALVANFTGR